MSERPIIFTGEMVRAILDGGKTVTRRVVKPQPPRPDDVRRLAGDGYHWINGAETPAHWRVAGTVCPYGAPGARLWVREAIRHTGHGCSEYVADGAATAADAWPWQRATLPGIFCPRGLSRIILEVTSVRMERVQDLSAEDCIAEGLSTTLRGHDAVCDLRDRFADLWDRINDKRGYQWAANPWVWRVGFELAATGGEHG